MLQAAGWQRGVTMLVPLMLPEVSIAVATVLSLRPERGGVLSSLHQSSVSQQPPLHNTGSQSSAPEQSLPLGSVSQVSGQPFQIRNAWC